MSEFDDFATRLGTSSDVSLQQSSPLSEDTQLSADQERIKRRTEAFNDIALQATRDSLGKVSNPIERKRLDAYYSLEQKQKFLEGNTIDKYHGLDGFQRMRIRKASDGDSGWIEDKDGNRYEFRLNSSSSTNIDTPDLLKSVQASSYKSRIQPEAVARASGKSVDQLTEFDYANYDHYAQNEFIKRITSKEGYKSEKYDPSKVYSAIDADGLEVYARFEGEDSTSSKRKLTTILNPYTGENVGYNSSLDPNVNADFSLFRSLRTKSNAQKALAAQRRGEYYRDIEMPENGYVDPNASIKRYYEEYGDRTPLDSFIGGYARQLGSAALSSAGNIAVALNDTLGGSEESKGIFDLRRFADKDVANIAVGMRKERRDAYNKYIQNVSSKFEEGDIAGGLWEFIKNPAQVSMFVAEQLGNMAPGIAATVATGGAGAASFGAATATDLLANIGMDFMEFKKNHGRSMDAGEMAKAYIRQLPAAVMDALSDKILVGNSNVLRTARYTPLRAAGEVAKEMGVEGSQEVVQNIASQMNAEDKSLAEAAADPSNISNFMLGALGGGLMSGPVGGGQAVRHYIKQANYDRIRQQYGEDYDKTAYHDGDTLREDHKAVRENLISSTKDSFDKAKESVDINGMVSNIGTLNNEIKNTQSGLSKRDVDHMRTSLYDMISDMVATTAANGMLSEDLNNVLKQLQDSLGVENNEQLKKELARYAEVYGSAAVGDKEGKTDEVFSRRNLVSNDYYENASDVENRAQRFEDLIQNLGGTKAEARKLLEEVAEENINDKNEGFNFSLAKAKQAQEEGNTDVYDSEVRHMTDRVKSMVMKMQDITEGLRSNMNKGATTDSRGFLSNDKFTIQYGNEKDSSRRGEKAQFRTSFKKEAFNYSTRGGLFKTTDQIASEARYMAEQLDSLNLSDKQKADIKQQLDLLQEYENDINHMGYELHRGIRGGFNYEADTDNEAILSEGETAKIKGAMEDYFHQYVTPNTGEKRLSPKEAVDLKKYVNTLSLGQLKAFQKSLDKQKDSIAYEGVFAAIKARESARGIATSHAKWRGTHYQNGKYIRSLIKTTQTTEKGKEAKIDNMVNGTHVDAINNANILEAHHEQLQQRIAKLEAKQNRTKREEKKLNELKAKLKNTKERLGTLERVSDARAKTIYNQNVKAVLENPTEISKLIAQVYNANKAQDAKINVRAIEKAVKMLRDTLHDASSMETDKAKLKDAKKALELLDRLLKKAEKTDRVLEGRDTIIHKLIDICSKENLRTLSDINFLKALKQSMEKFKDKLGDRLEAYKGPYKEALYNLAYKIRLIERNDEKLARGIIYDINHNGDLDDLKSRAADYEKKITKLQAKKSISPEEQKTLNRYKQYTSAIAKQAKKLEDRANEFEGKLPDRPDIFAINDIDELEDLDRTVVNSLAQLYDPKSEFYGNKLVIQKVMEVRKDIQARIAELSEKQDASESFQNGSESTETGQDEQSTTETAEGSQNGSEGANLGSQAEVLNVWHATGENANLSNLALRPFDYDGRHYQSVEHAYQTLKSGSFDEAIYSDPRWSKAGTKIQGKKGTNKNTNLQLMRDLIRESFKQNDSARKELLATGNAKFTHKRPNGSNGIWETEFPRILEEVREELKDYQPEIDNSDVYTLEQNLQQFLDTYQEIDESLLPEDIRDALTEISDRMDEVSKYANNPAISKYYGTLQKLYHDYEQLLKEAVANDNSSVSATSTSTSIDVDLPELSSDPKEAAVEAQIQEVIKRYWNLDPDQPSGYFAKAIDELLDAYGLTAKLSAEKFNIYNELYIQLSDQYNAAFYDALDREAEAKRNKRDKIEDTPREEETTEQLRKRLIVGGTEETDEADSEAEQERKYRQLHFPKHLTSRWSQKALNGAFKDIKNIRNIFGAKESSMTLHGLPDSIIPDNWRDYQDDPESPLYRDAPLGKLVALAVDSLSKILVTYHFSKDTPLTRWDAKKKKYVPITELNGILNNILRNSPHVQLLYQPDLSTMEIGKNYKGFKTSYIMDAMINPNTAVAIILGVAELFANRSVSSIFNPKTNEEIASAFGMNPDNIDPMDLQVFTKVANKYGVFKKNISTTLGHLIMDNLGLKRGNKLEEESYTIYDNSVAALGNVGLLLAEELGFITSTRVYTGEFPAAPSPTASQQEKDAFQREVSKYLKSRHLDELDITPEQAVHLGLGQSNVRYFYKYNESQETDNAVKELWLGPVVDTADKGEYLGDSAPVYTREEEFGAKSFKTGRDTLTRTPLLNSKDVHNSPTRRKQPSFRLTESRMRVLNKESEAPYYINTPILDEILKTCDGNKTKMRKLLLTRMGWDNRIEDDDFDDLSYDEKTKIKGKNENLERELDAFLDYTRLQKDLENEGKFFGYFFRYFGSANGRSFMDTNTLNPQTSKAFPRFLCQPETTYQAYDLNNVDDIQCELFAVAQAFDCLKSYYSSKENESRNGVSLAGRLLGLDVVNGDIADIQKRLETLRGIQRDLILNDGDTNADKYKEIGWNGGFENFGQAVVAIDHCVRRLEAVLAKGGKTKGASISSYLSVENDSTTSGYVIKFLLMPLDKDLLAEYGLKVGYLNHALIQNNPNFSNAFKERIKGYTSIDQLKADPEFLDIYKTGAVEMVNEYEAMKREAEKKQETLGEVAFNSLCTVESKDKEDDTRELNSFGKKVDNAGIDAVDVDHAIKTVEAAIPHPEKDPKTGLWKVSSVLRNLMKPIIMIFGYNASNESCEKRFGEAVMDEHIKIFVNLYNKKGIYGSKGKAMLAPIAYDLYKGKRSKEEIDAIFNFMTDIAQRVTGYKNQKSAIDKLVKALRAKSPYAIKFKPIARDQAGVYNTISVAEWYKLVVGGTFGKAVTKFLDKKFGAYGKANRHLNNASKITFKLYSHVRNALIKQRLAKLIEQDGNPNASDTAKSRIQSLKKKYAPQVAKNGGKLSVNFMGISDLKTREVRVIDNICRPLLPVFQMPETDADKVNPKTGAVVSTNIRSVDTTSADLSNSSAATPIKSKDIDGNSMPEYVPRSDNEADGYKFENDTLNSYGDITEFSSGDRMLAVLLIHFVDGVLAEHTMDHMLQLKKYLTVIHDAFVLSAKDGKFLDQGFNEALAKVCEYFNPFEIVAIALNQMKKISFEICEKNSIPDFDFRAPLNPKRFGSSLFNPTYGQVQHEIIELSKLVKTIKREIFNSNDQIILANLGGDTGGQYTIAGAAKVPGVGNEVSTLTAQEKAQAGSDALGSRASAWKDKYDIQRIEQEANSSKEGRAKIFQSLNEWDEAEGPVKNDEEYLKQAQELLNEINPERFTNLQYEEAISQQDAEAKGVYFTGRDGSQRRVTIIKPTAIANEADRKNRLASRQLSAAAMYMHEMIHPAVSEAVANPDLYGVTREVSALREFYNAVADKIDYTFFRPDNYNSLTEAEKKLADESAQKYYDYMFNSTDKDTLGGFQEFIANALSDPRMIELLNGMDASAYSEEYRGKNFFEKIFYIVKHIFKAMFGNEESKGKVLRTMGTLGLESKRQGSIYDAMRNLTVQISYANAYAANKMQNGKLSKLENVFEALNSAAQVIKPVNDFVSDKIKWAFDLGGVSNRFERTYKSLEEIIRAQGITEGSSKLDTLKTLLMCPFSHNMRVALADTLIDCCSLGQRSTFAHFIRDISDKDDATRQLEGLASLRNNIDRMSRGAGAAYAANILDAFRGTISDEDSIACTKIGVACDLQSLLTNGYSIEDIQKLSSGDGIEEAIASHETAIAKFYENDKDGEMKTIWTRNQCIGLAHFMNTNKGNPAQCLNAYAIARGFLCSKKNKEADEKLIGHIDCLASLIAMQNADPSHRLAISKMNSKGLKTVLECHRSLIGKAFDAGYIERAHMIKGWHSSIIDDTKDYAVAPVDPATVKAMADDGYKLHTQLPVDGMTDASMGFYIKSVTTPQHRQGAALQITGKRAIGQSLNSFMESNEHIIGDRRDYITRQIKKAHFIRTKMQARMETLDGLSYEDFDNRGLVGSYYTPVISPNGDVTDFRITMFNDFKDAIMNRNNNICDVMSKMAMTNTVKTSAGGQNTNIVHFLIDDMEKNMDPDTHRARRQFENLGEVVLGSKELRNKHDIKYVRVRIDPDSEFAAPDVPAAIIPEEMREAMRRLEKNGDGLWVREDWLYQIFGTPDISLADAKVMQKENMRAARFGIRLAENIAKALATLAKVAIVFKKPQVLVGNAVSNYLFHIMNGHNPVTAAAMDTENLQLVVKYMQTEKEINRLDIKKDIGEATASEKARLNRLRSALENNPIHKLVQAGLFSAIVEDNSKKDQDSMKAMLRYISDNPKMQKVAKSVLGDAFDMKTIKGKIAGQLYMREGTPLYDFIYAMTQYSDFVSRCTDYRIGMKQMPESFRGNADMKRKYETALIQQIRDDYINYDSPQSKAMNYVNAVGLTFFTKYFFRIQRVIRRTTTRRPLMAFSMFAANAHFDMPDNIFEQIPLSKNYGAIFHTPWSNAADLVFPPAFGAYNPANWWIF